jgi:hypothetical protein
MVYKFKEGSRINGDPQVFGDHIESLRIKRGGTLTAEDVLSDAKRARSPLHDHFEWNDSAAAEQYRLVQAREILRAIVVVYEEAECNPVRAFVTVNADAGTQFTSIEHAMSESDLRMQVLQRAKRELDDWRRRYSDLVEFSKLFTVIDKIAI